ncbi:hypothetical protein MKX01_031276 [Papaver californicum]|nr:hypothetical protein MKX01_031276 [Papaver californicum]
MAVSNHFTTISSNILKSSPPKTFFTDQQRIPSRNQVNFNLSSRNPVHNLFYNANSFQKPSIQSFPYPNYNPVKNLFTGIVEEMGEIKQLRYAENSGFEMKISGNVILEDVKLGDSISVNESDFSVGLARKTSLIELVPGSRVNLERALQPSTRMGGHFVQGHLDGTGEIVSSEFEGDSLWVKVKTPPEVLKFIVPKGFIAVDGTSLTVCKQNVVIPLKKVAQKVNLEVDILGKYVERLLQSGFTSNITPK